MVTFFHFSVCSLRSRESSWSDWTRVCERMSCEESKDNVYICRYPLKVFCQKTQILYQMFYDLRWSDLSNMGDICKIGKKMADSSQLILSIIQDWRKRRLRLNSGQTNLHYFLSGKFPIFNFRLSLPILYDPIS